MSKSNGRRSRTAEQKADVTEYWELYERSEGLAKSVSIVRLLAEVIEDADQLIGELRAREEHLMSKLSHFE